MRRHILIVDDEPNMLNSLERLLDEDGYAVHRAKGRLEGFTILEKIPDIGVILPDQRMLQMTDFKFSRLVKSNHNSKIRKILSGYSELQTLTEAIIEGFIFTFVCKPWDDELLLKTINEAFEYNELLEKNRRLSQELIETNCKLEQLNGELEARINEKTYNLKLHIASLKAQHETLEYFPFGVIGLDNDLIVVLEDAKARILLTGSSALGLHVLRALKAEIQDVLPETNHMIHGNDILFMEPKHDQFSLQIHCLGSSLESLIRLSVALPDYRPQRGNSLEYEHIQT